MTVISRRRCLSIVAWLALVPMPASAQLKPFRLRVVRLDGLAATLSINDCIPGALYLVDEFHGSEVGQKIADTLELPYRSNSNEISAIPTGIFRGHVRTDGKLGWRIEFDAIPGGRSNIQIHPGNRTSEIEGCILVGASANQRACSVASSQDSRDSIKKLYGDNSARPIEIKVEGS